MGSLAPHEFVKSKEVNPEFVELPKSDVLDDTFNYMLEAYMDDYIALAIPRSRYKLHHFSKAVMTGIHEVFPSDKGDDEDAISLKKIIKKKVARAIIKNVLVFKFDGNPREGYIMAH